MSTDITAQADELKDLFMAAFSPYDETAVVELLQEIFDERDSVARNACIEIAKKAAEECRAKTRFRDDLRRCRAEQTENERAMMSDGLVHISNRPHELEKLLEGYKCGDYLVDDSGVYRLTAQKNGGMLKLRICSHPLIVKARYLNIEDHTEKVVVSYTVAGAWHTVTVEREVIASSNKIVRLANSSVDITSETSKAMVKYIQHLLQLNTEHIPIYETVGRLGWTSSGEFVPYSENIQCDAADNFKDVLGQLKSKGNFETWRQGCIELRKNICLRMVMAASFAAPLIERVGGLPFIVHLWGGTGTGKTVALCVAASVWGKGDYADNALIQSFKATEYALNEKAAFLYSLPVLIDEGQTVKNKDAFDTLIMNLAEGKGKVQGAASGGIRKLKHWSNCFITTAEENIIKYNSGGGTYNRVISIAAPGRIIKDGTATMRVIGNNYGFAGKIFVEHVQSIEVKDLQTRRDRILDKLIAETDSTGKQLMAMSLLMLADELSEECIFKSGTSLTVEDVQPFLLSKDAVDNANRACEWLMGWIAQNSNRFEPPNSNPGEIWGKIEQGVAIINKNALTEHLSRAGFDYGAVMPELAKRGKLILTKQGRWLHNTRVYGIKSGYVKIVIADDFVDIDGDIPKEFEQEEMAI